MNYLTVYSDLKFFKELDLGLSTGDELTRLNYAEHIFKIKSLINCSNLHLLSSDDKREFLQSISFKIFFKSGTTQPYYDESIIPTEEQLSDSIPTFTHSIFLLSSDHIHESRKIESTGLITIRSDKLEDDIKRIFIHELINKNANISLTTHNLKVLDVPCNAIILIDKYFFTNRKSWPTSLESILNVLLPPENCTTQIHFSIVTDTAKEQDKREDIQIIEEQIRHLRGSHFPFIVNIYHIETYGHLDRHILTNYHLITSGHGFDLGRGRETVIYIDFIGNASEYGNATLEAYQRLALQCGTVISSIKQTGKTISNKIRVAHGAWQVGNRLVNCQ
jgi:hypothetical protein